MLQWDGVVMMVMKVLVMMMILMKPSSMTVMMAMISPSLPPGRNFLGRFLPVGEFSLRVCFPPRRGGRVFLRSSSQS
jgi:hypothetical protein